MLLTTVLLFSARFGLNPLAVVAQRHLVYKTEPEIVNHYFDIQIATPDASSLADGYIFFDPSGSDHAFGPQIYKPDGTLVWYNDLPNDRRVQDFHACDYMGEKGNHLCWNEMLGTSDINNRNPGNKFVADSSYNIVRQFDGSMPGAQPNLHEFRMIHDGHSYLQPIYPLAKMDLRPYGGLNPGYAWDSCFQEVNSTDEDIIFQWCWLDYFAVWDTNLFFIDDKTSPRNPENATSFKAGKGTHAIPWDIAHLNSVDKNEEGDYLISCRHSDQIIKLAGLKNNLGLKAGSVIWVAGGKLNDFEREDDWNPYSKQHAARFVSTAQDETVFSLLDNAWEGANIPSNKYSSGMTVAVNNETRVSRLVQRFIHPTNETTESQGNTQIQPNGNVFVGWGYLSEFSEYAANGTLLMHTVWENRMVEGRSHSYRTFKAPWAGTPRTKPKLVSYSQYSTISPSSPLIAAVSWNGATNVAKWRFSISTRPSGPWHDLGEWPNTGFETEVELLWNQPLALAQIRNAPYYVLAEGLAANGSILGNQTTRTFVPTTFLRSQCTTHGCREPLDRFEYDLKSSCGANCPTGGAGLGLRHMLVSVLIIAIFEFIDVLFLGIFAAKMPWHTQCEISSSPLRPRPLGGDGTLEIGGGDGGWRVKKAGGWDVGWYG